MSTNDSLKLFSNQKPQEHPKIKEKEIKSVSEKRNNQIESDGRRVLRNNKEKKNAREELIIVIILNRLIYIDFFVVRLRIYWLICT